MAWNDGLDASNIAYRIAAAPDPRIRVIAGPGTGKSFAMKRRVARLLEDGVDPGCILAVTFTRVAAADLHRELVWRPDFSHGTNNPDFWTWGNCGPNRNCEIDWPEYGWIQCIQLGRA